MVAEPSPKPQDVMRTTCTVFSYYMVSASKLDTIMPPLGDIPIPQMPQSLQQVVKNKRTQKEERKREDGNKKEEEEEEDSGRQQEEDEEQ